MKNNKLLAALGCGLALLALALPGCTKISRSDYQKLQSPEQPLLSQIPKVFDEMIAGQLKETALDMDELWQHFSSEGSDFAALCKQYGFRQSEDIQCNFAVRLKGEIVEVNRKSRKGMVTVKTPGGQSVRVQIGPVIGGTALRDILKSVTYLDFNDQTVYGDFGQKINELCAERAAKTEFKEGATLEVLGAFSTWDIPSTPSQVQIAPVSLNQE